MKIRNNIITKIVLSLILIAAISCSYTTASASLTGPIYNGTDLDTIIGSENSDFIEMNSSNFAGFVFDEKLQIYGGEFVSGRTIDKGGLSYHTSIIQSDYQSDFADELATYTNKDTFPIIGLFTEEYVPTDDDDAGELVKLLLDSDDKYILRVGSALELPEGYALTAKQIDADGNKVQMVLSKDGEFIEDEVIDITAGNSTWDYDTNIGSQADVIVFRALITEISKVDNHVVIEGLWLIDFQNVYEINSADEFGILEVDSVSNSLSMMNYEPINLLPASTQEIAEGLKFKVNSPVDYLEFYLATESVGPIEPKTIYVNDDGTANYTTITEAVYNANDKDTIIVYSGTYVENVFVNKELIIISQSGNPNETIVQAANSTDHVFYVTADNVTISGFNVTGANDEFYWLLGIYLNEVENCNIVNNVLSDNICGILLSRSSNNTLLDNLVSENYIGIVFEESINNTILNNNVSNNHYSGIDMLFSSGNILNSNNISNNEDVGIFLYGSQENTIYDNYFSNIQNIETHDSENSWNITKTEGLNIVGGSFVAGNFWAKPDDTGFSQTCNDTDGDGICDMSYELDMNNIDYLPLSLKQSEPILPISDFTANVSKGEVPLTVQFIDTSTNADSWEWDVDGDGEVDYTTQNPTHIYDILGTYNVTLTVSNEMGSETKTKVGYIRLMNVGFTLQPGWNLISFPEKLAEASIDHVLQDFSDSEIDMVFYDDVSSGMMIVPAEFEALKGYWVHNNMSEPAPIDELYLESKVPSGPASLKLYPGWNAIGHTAKVELPAEYALITIDDSYVKVKGPWIPAEKEYAYVGYNNEEGIMGGNQVGTDVFSMNMYEGYYVFVEDECVLA